MTPWLVLFLLAQDESARAAAADQAGDFQTAARLYHLAAEKDPSEANLLQLANHLIRYNGAGQALKVLEWAREKHPRSAPLRVAQAAAHYALSQFDQAAATICQAVDLDPADRRTLPFLADLRDVSALHKAALAARLAAYAKQYPDDAFARYHFALTLVEPAEQERELRAARRLDPKLAGPALELGILLDRQGRTAQAEAMLKEAIRLDGRSINAHYRMAQLYSRSGRSAQAKYHYEEVKKLKELTAASSLLPKRSSKP